MSAQGQHARATFNRAIERRNLLVAEAAARETPLDLGEALSLTRLIAELAPERFEPYARRWLARLASERPLSLAELDVAVTALRALPSARAEEALRALI